MYQFPASKRFIHLSIVIQNRLVLVRIYAYLSIVSALAVAAASLLDVIVHFSLKNQIISVCSQLTNGDELVYVRGSHW